MAGAALLWLAYMTAKNGDVAATHALSRQSVTSFCFF